MSRFLCIALLLGACGTSTEPTAHIQIHPADLCWLVEQPLDCLDDSDGVFSGTFDAAGTLTGSLTIHGLETRVDGAWLQGRVEADGISGTYFARTDADGGFAFDVKANGLIGEVVGVYASADTGNGLVVGRFLLREASLASVLRR